MSNRPLCLEDRLEQANEMLRLFSECSKLEYERGIYFVWTDCKGNVSRKRWVPTEYGSDYPSVHRILPFGGTCTRATMELTRWVRGIPVRPIEMWHSFVRTGGASSIIETAKRIGWPQQVPCVMCGRLVGDGIAWDHYDHRPYKPGPGCYYGEGCKAEKAGAA